MDGLIDIMLDVVCSENDLFINGRRMPFEVVKSRMLKLNCQHIQYVMDCLNNNTTQVKNIKNYLIATLYNAPATIGCYYTLTANYDMNKI